MIRTKRTTQRVQLATEVSLTSMTIVARQTKQLSAAIIRRSDAKTIHILVGVKNVTQTMTPRSFVIKVTFVRQATATLVLQAQSAPSLPGSRPVEEEVRINMKFS